MLWALRHRAALALVLMLGLALPWMGFAFEGDGTMPGRLRVLLTFAVSACGYLLMACMLFLAATALDAEIVDKQVYVLDVKPVARWQVLVGKGLGLLILAAQFIVIFACQTYIAILCMMAGGESPFWIIMQSWVLVLLALGVYVAKSRALAGSSWLWLLRIGTVGVLIFAGWLFSERIPAWQARVARRVDTFDVRNAYNRVLVSRRSYRPDVPDLDEEVERMRKRMMEENAINPEEWPEDKLDKHLRAMADKRVLMIAIGGQRDFVFSGLPPGGTLDVDPIVRFRIFGLQPHYGTGWLTTGWQVFNPVTGERGPIRMERHKGKSVGELTISSRFISGDGRLGLRIHNTGGGLFFDGTATPEMPISIGLKEGLELLVPASSFESNFARGWVLVWIQTALIILIGVCGNAFLQGPVTLFLIFAGVIMPGLLNSFVHKAVSPHKHPMLILDEMKDPLHKRVGKALAVAGLAVLPDFDETNPMTDWNAGREISWWRILRQMLIDLLLRSGAFVVIGGWWYSRREVGMPIIV